MALYGLESEPLTFGTWEPLSFGAERQRSSSGSSTQTASYGSPGGRCSSPTPSLDSLESSPRASQCSGGTRRIKSTRYKTELCRSFEESGSCKYADKCQFAHGIAELRSVPRHPKFKTEMCKTFHSSGFCPYGPRCHFVHSEPPEQLAAVRRQANSLLLDPASLAGTALGTDALVLHLQRVTALVAQRRAQLAAQLQLSQTEIQKDRSTLLPEVPGLLPEPHSVMLDESSAFLLPSSSMSTGAKPRLPPQLTVHSDSYNDLRLLRKITKSHLSQINVST